MTVEVYVDIAAYISTAVMLWVEGYSICTYPGVMGTAPPPSECAERRSPLDPYPALGTPIARRIVIVRYRTDSEEPDVSLFHAVSFRFAQESPESSSK